MSEGHDPWAAMRQPQFQLYAAGRLASATAMTLINATVAYQVFRISDSAFQLGMIGLARFLPALGLASWAVRLRTRTTGGGSRWRPRWCRSLARCCCWG